MGAGDVAEALRAVSDELSVGRVARDELAERLAARGVSVGGGRMPRILMAAELCGLACVSGRIGRQFAYASMEDAAGPSGSLGRDEALARLAETYFSSRGPATASDFAWWSGLSAADAARGMESLGSGFERASCGGKAAAFRDSGSADVPERRTFLMPDYDEYVLCYRDRSAVSGLLPLGRKAPINADRDKRIAIVRGQICGEWTESGKGASASAFAPLTDGERSELDAAAARYAAFRS
jgi:hypothetical protein